MRDEETGLTHNGIRFAMLLTNRTRPRVHTLAGARVGILTRHGAAVEGRFMNGSRTTKTTSRTTLVAAFADRLAAERAVDDLERAGFKSDQIGFAIRGKDEVRGGMITDASGTKDGKGAAAGAVAGGVTGAVLAAAASLLLPGVGPVVAGGILTMAFGGAVAGTAVGGILGAMKGLEVSEEEAKFYDSEFQSGRALVAVKPGLRAADAAAVLRKHGGYDLESRRRSPVPTEGVFSQP